MLLRPIAFLCALLASSGVAYADGSAYAPCTRTPSASDVEGAKGLHQAAKQYLAKQLYERAIQSWLDAYNFDCTKPEVFINIGKSYEGLGNVEKAIVAYRTYVERKGSAADPDTVERLKALRAKIEKPKPATPAGPTSTGGVPNPDRHSKRTLANPYDLPPASRSKTRTGPWVLTGSGGAATIAGAILLAVGSSKVASAEKICPDRNCAAAAEGTSAEDILAAQTRGNDGLTLQRVGAPVLAVGLGAVGGGLLWHFLGKGDKAPKSSTWRVQLTPEVGFGRYGLTSRVHF